MYNITEEWPIPNQHVILYMTYCFERGLSPKSIMTYIAGLNYFHKLIGHHDISNEFIINKLLEGCRRNRVTFDNRAPITMASLIKICESFRKFVTIIMKLRYAPHFLR
jgi:hypothetical protein